MVADTDETRSTAPAETVPIPATDGRTDSPSQRRAAYKFFMDLVHGAAAEQPRDEWQAAWDSYEDDPEGREGGSYFVNLWRPRVDTQAAFLSSEPPVLRFTVPTAHSDDDTADERMKCEQAVYDYIHREMNYADVIERLGHAGNVINVAYVGHQPDIDKWLPALIYLEPEQVAIDATCGPDISKAGWVAYAQLSSPDELHALYEDIPLSVFLGAAKASGYEAHYSDEPAAKAARERITAGPKGLKQCLVWRIFARGSYAMYDREPTEPDASEDGEAKRPDAVLWSKEGESRRYLFLVEGMDVPLVDELEWPPQLLLDKDEWPITDLCYNRARQSVYGFPDFRHERQLLKEIDRVSRNLSVRKGIEGLVLGTKDGYTELTIPDLKKTLQKGGIQLLKNLFDAEGRPRVAALDLPGITDDDMTYLAALINLYDQVAMQPRATRGDEDPDKTATATQIETDMATARANRRLRRYEAVLATIAKKTMQMAHVMLPRLTLLKKADAQPTDALVAMSWVDTEAALTEGTAELRKLGVEAIAGPESAAVWIEVPGGKAGAAIAGLLLRSVRVSVERGSTQRYARIQKVQAFRPIFTEMIAPVAEVLQSPGAMVESIRKVLTMLGLDEFDSIMDELDGVLKEIENRAKAEEAVAAAIAPQGGAPGAAPQAGLPPGGAV